MNRAVDYTALLKSRLIKQNICCIQFVTSTRK